MKKYKKLFGRKFEINLAGWGIGCCILMLFCVPILGNTLGNETTYSEVLLDGEVIGAVADPEEVDQAFLNARARSPGRLRDWYWPMWSAAFSGYRSCSEAL